MQSQKSLCDQLNALVALANKSGLYDAADWIVRSREAQVERAEKSKQSAGSR